MFTRGASHPDGIAFTVALDFSLSPQFFDTFSSVELVGVGELDEIRGIKLGYVRRSKSRCFGFHPVQVNFAGEGQQPEEAEIVILPLFLAAKAIEGKRIGFALGVHVDPGITQKGNYSQGLFLIQRLKGVTGDAGRIVIHRRY